MAYGVLVPSKIMATNVETLNRTAVSGSDIENGMVFRLDSYSTGSGQGEVFAVTQAATGSLVNVWMAYSPEIVTLYAGNSAYKGIDLDPRNFYTKAGDMIDAFKPQPGDLILASADLFTGARSTEGYACLATGTWQLAWNANHDADALAFKYLATEYITIASGSAIASQRVTAYKLVCLAN